MSKENNSFDYKSYAEKNNIDKKTLDKIIEEAYDEFPDDEMMAELHVVRALRAHKRHYH
jgi:hypothetical protein